MKYLTLYIENGLLKSIEHEKKGQVSRFWCDNFEMPMKGFTDGINDETTENYDEALALLPAGAIQEIELINSFNTCDI